MIKTLAATIILLAMLGISVLLLFGKNEPNRIPPYIPQNTPTTTAPTTTSPETSAPSEPLTITDGGVNFSGKVTEVDNACTYDGICRIKVDDKWIITEFGGDPAPDMVKSRGPKGKILDATGQPMSAVAIDLVGKEVLVFAKPVDANGKEDQSNPTGYSLYGNEKFFISLAFGKQ